MNERSLRWFSMQESIDSKARIKLFSFGGNKRGDIILVLIGLSMHHKGDICKSVPIPLKIIDWLCKISKRRIG